MNIPITGGRALRAAFTGFIIASFALLARVDAAAPLAGTLIGNQASATYKDESQTVRSVLSNTVVTEVLQVNAFALTQNNDRAANAGSQVFFPHTVTNQGNGPDTYTLGALDVAGSDDFNFVTNSIKIYIDADGDGNPDNYTPITTTGPLAAGASFRFVVAATVPTGATNTQKGQVTVTATPLSGIAAITNTDTATVTEGAVMQVTKAASKSSGKPGDDFIYTITYRNTGLGAASNFAITDVIPTGLTVGEARWSVTVSGTLTSTALPLTPASGSIAYNLTGQTAKFVIESVGPGVSGYVTIKATVPTGQAPAILPNTAQYDYDSSGFTAPGVNTNTVNFEILPVVDLTFTGETKPTANAGSSVVFANTLTNDGTGTDTFNIVVNEPGTFPAGTTFQLLKSDGATPLTDTNGDGIADTGPVIKGASYTVYLRANIPSNAKSDDPVSVTKTATSTVDSSKSKTATDTLNEIKGPGVDLKGVAVTGNGAGTTTRVDNAPGNPGTTVTLTLTVENTGVNPDTFNLVAYSNGGELAVKPTFGTTNSLPAGWNLVFKDGSTVITNTGVIGAGGTKNITVEITIPSGTSPGDVDFYFQAKSPSTGSSDYLRDYVSVNTVRGITLQTNNVGQTFPGGSVVYQHTLTNIGNVTEGQTSGQSSLTIALADTLGTDGFTSVVYYDINGNGVIDAGEPIVPTSGGSAVLSSVKGTGLAKGESIRLLVKVQAPIGAADGATNVTTLTVTPAGAINTIPAPAVVSNTDTTNVIRGNLTIVKAQSLDGSTWTQGQLSANPGAKIYYKITVTNVGSAAAEDVVVNDTVPTNTAISTPAPATTVGTAAASGGNIVFTIGTLAPAASAEMTFAVTINNN